MKHYKVIMTYNNEALRLLKENVDELKKNPVPLNPGFHKRSSHTR